MIIYLLFPDRRRPAANQRTRLQHDDPQGGARCHRWIRRPSRSARPEMVGSSSCSSRCWEHLSKPNQEHLRRCLEARCAACRSTSHRSSSPGADLHTDKSCGQPCARGLTLGCKAQHHCQGGIAVDKLKRQNHPKQSLKLSE